jgi:hypothetical protein
MTDTWIARDSQRVLPGVQPSVCIFFGQKPELTTQGFWQQPNNESGRKPLDRLLGLKPGQLARVNLVMEKA